MNEKADNRITGKKKRESYTWPRTQHQGCVAVLLDDMVVMATTQVLQD